MIFTCPFCRMRCNLDLENNVVTYDLPSCPRFNRPGEDALDFVRAVNLEIAKQKGIGLA